MIKKTTLTLEDGSSVNATAPLIISASRRTDIPAFHGEWFMEQMRKGYFSIKNPFNQKISFVSSKFSEFIVFWTKNPIPFIPHLREINEMGKDFYFQFTINDYDDLEIEPNIPKLDRRIDAFKFISQKYGFNSVVWRFDPLFIVDGKLTVDGLIKRVANVYHKLGKVKRLVFSFADINSYRKVSYNVRSSGIRELNNEEQIYFCEQLSKIIDTREVDIRTCSEFIDLSRFGINHNSCVDPFIINEIRKEKNKIPLSINIKDNGQRKDCGCIESKDIGFYDSCSHGCLYCYANTFPSKKI